MSFSFVFECGDLTVLIWRDVSDTLPVRSAFLLLASLFFLSVLVYQGWCGSGGGLARGTH